tara:strand:+ start:754 stop:990 length:237 start_codon:yes stop_codon:yes gene_type:complete
LWKRLKNIKMIYIISNKINNEYVKGKNIFRKQKHLNNKKTKMFKSLYTTRKYIDKYFNSDYVNYQIFVVFNNEMESVE